MKEKLQLNWGLRLQNKNYIIRVLLTIGITILGYFGMEAADMTTWQGVLDTLLEAISNPYLLGLVLWNVLNISIDPTTKGIADSPAALEKHSLYQQTMLKKDSDTSE